ncbi:hypothetical protein [Streptomyces sp. CA-111067]|uniref:hypothetical protein n=1 Tax=Streptomyces sp. CA-111067 TaxID=3240046 RepID=UPI003D975635
MAEDMTGGAKPEAAPPEESYFTVETCSRCGAEVHGLHGRWTCSSCGECSPYSPPPEGWQADPGYRLPPSPPPPFSGRSKG